MKKFRWYTNGKLNIKVYDDSIVEADFTPGFTVQKNYRKHDKNEKLFKQFAKEKKLNSLQNRIDSLCKTKSFDEVYDILKFNNFLDAFLKDLVLERYLIHQIATMPKFFSTIASQLNDLYNENALLKNRVSVKTYFLAALYQTSQ